MLLGWALILDGCADAEPPEAAVAGPAKLAEGKLLYERHCASCHGANLEGQPDWRTRRPDGKLPAPPHDASGHTWHHDTEQLFRVTKYGLKPPDAPPNYASDMPAYGAFLNDDQIRSVLAYIASNWPQEVLGARRQRFGRGG